MLILAICIATNILLVVCFKMFDRLGVQLFPAIVFNYFVCAILGSFYVGHIPLIRYGFETHWVPFGLTLGLLFIVGFNIAALSVRHAGMAITTIMQRMSLLLTAAFAVLFFHESAGASKVMGLLLAMLAVFLVNLKEGDQKRPISRLETYLYPALILVFSAGIEIILFYVHETGLSHNADAELTTFAFSTAGVLGTIGLLFMYISGKTKFRWRDLIGGMALGVPNFFSIYLILRLLVHGFDGSVLFPVLNVAVVAGATLIGVLGFREPFRFINALGVASAILAIVLIAIG